MDIVHRLGPTYMGTDIYHTQELTLLDRQPANDVDLDNLADVMDIVHRLGPTYIALNNGLYMRCRYYYYLSKPRVVEVI
jgi:hypothetical protein